METTLFNIQGQEKGKVTLPGLFETKISHALLHEVITGYLANQRAGTHSTKTRGEVSGGSRKPWKQKGTGNARAGSSRSPLWRKGGIIFGPRPHGYYQNLSQQKRRLSLKMALTAKAESGDIIVIEDIVLAEAKTKKVAEILNSLKVSGMTVLLVTSKSEPQLKLAGRNIDGLVIEEANKLNTYQVLWANKVVLTTSVVEMMKKNEAEGK